MQGREAILRLSEDVAIRTSQPEGAWQAPSGPKERWRWPIDRHPIAGCLPRDAMGQVEGLLTERLRGGLAIRG